VLRCAAVCCSVLQCVTERYILMIPICFSCVAVCCSVLQFVAVCYRTLYSNDPDMLFMWCGVLPNVIFWWSRCLFCWHALDFWWHVAVCYGVLQCVAMCYRLQFVHVLVLFFAHMIRIIRLRTMFRRTSEHGHSLEKKRKRVKDGKRHSLRLTVMGLLWLVRSLKL